MRTTVFVAAATLAWGLAASCTNDDAVSCTGAEHCACFGDGTCNEGLDCRSRLCVNLNSTGFEDASGGGIDVEACLSCAEATCTTESNACKAATGCDDIIQCMVGCGSDATCLSKCNANASADANVKSLAYQSCAFSRCANECSYAGGQGTGGTGGTGGGGKGGSSGSGSGGRAGSAGTTGTGGSAVVELISGINWLGISGDAAPATMGPNGKLGINGVFYAYGDGCATVNWDPVSRCVSGELCLVSAANWGVAIGFDFNNTGDTGSPPNTKLTWNASSSGVTGFAWETRSPLFNSFQFWVLNMDPTWNGQCSAAECNINGPPDGTPSASADGQLPFGDMVKDNWGGTGIAYAFNVADISALQFKIPGATNSLATGYSLCIDRLGVIR
jgi:hypothetical protein